MTESNTLHIPAWYGEFGWEIMSWVPWQRKRSRGYGNIVASSFAGMQPLYDDFVTQFIPHPPGQRRSLDYPKAYRVDGEHYKYGDAKQAKINCDVLVHLRGIRRKAAINYNNWPAVLLALADKGLMTGAIGTSDDGYYPIIGHDLRDIPLTDLCNEIAAARLIVGVSAGPMHLAAACGTDIVCWGDARTYFWETLQQRYEQTWNPHNVRVGWLTADNWQPGPAAIIKEIEELL